MPTGHPVQTPKFEVGEGCVIAIPRSRRVARNDALGVAPLLGRSPPGFDVIDGLQVEFSASMRRAPPVPPRCRVRANYVAHAVTDSRVRVRGTATPGAVVAAVAAPYRIEVRDPHERSCRSRSTDLRHAVR